MARPARHDTAVLATLERHRRLLLKEARALQARHEVLVARAEDACARAQQLLESALAAQRSSMLQSGVVAVQDLRRAHHYASARAAALAELRAARERHLQELAQARGQVAARLTDVKAIEKLRARLQRTESKWLGRRDQFRLDELGIIKAWKEVTCR